MSDEREQRIRELMDDSQAPFSDSDVLAFLEGLTEAAPVVLVRAGGKIRVRMDGVVVPAHSLREAVLRFNAMMMVDS